MQSETNISFQMDKPFKQTYFFTFKMLISCLSIIPFYRLDARWDRQMLCGTVQRVRCLSFVNNVSAFTVFL